MSRVRFATASALLEAFPEVSRKISVPLTDQKPLDFLRGLLSQGKMEDAVTFCAYLLPRREAVWWGCGCARLLQGDIAKDRAAGLLAAEAWVYKPDDDNRQEAMRIGTEGDSNNPLVWLALAAGWAGGFSNPKRQVPVPAYMTARAVRVAVLGSSTNLPKAERTARLRTCIEDGIKLAETGL